MNIIVNVFAEQWVFMLIAAIAVGITFAFKKLVPNFYNSFLKCGLTLLVVLLIVLALLFKLPDLFLLIPIIIMCCELFGYSVTGKVVAVLFVDFLLIQLDYNVIAKVTNGTVMTIVFYALQILAAICIGIIMDQYLREKQANDKKLDEAEASALNEESDSTTEKVQDFDDAIEEFMNSIGEISETDEL
ncbi:MAG: hypothetical protein U0L18_04285 [Acutalibacteraceae bacterium]|nr:hypothetical protein [Acutalibacteraceae bacterium]